MENCELRNKIKVQRAIKNLTQEELASEIGVTRKTINTIENGKFIPSTILAIKLSRFFNVTVEDLFELIE
jgi:putative transcriptional regulator